MKRLARYILAAAGILSVAAPAMAQDYYDDDIYYDASKAKKETKKPQKAKNNESRYSAEPASQYYYDGASYVPWNNVGEYQSADSYNVAGTSTRDVDEYNRRTQSAASEQVDSITLQQFEEMSNTRNLARFHGSQTAKDAYVENTGDYADGYDTYGYQQPTSNVTINLVGGYPYYNSWNSPWYWNSWGYYDPFWGWGWTGRRGHGAGGLLGHGDRHGAHHGAGVPPGGGGRRGDGVVRYGVAQADLITPLQEPMHLTVHINPPELTAIIPTATVLWAATVGR